MCQMIQNLISGVMQDYNQCTYPHNFSRTSIFSTMDNGAVLLNTPSRGTKSLDQPVLSVGLVSSHETFSFDQSIFIISVLSLLQMLPEILCVADGNTTQLTGYIRCPVSTINNKESRQITGLHWMAEGHIQQKVL